MLRASNQHINGVKKEEYFSNIDGTFLPDSMKNKEESDFTDQDISKKKQL